MNRRKGRWCWTHLKKPHSSTNFRVVQRRRLNECVSFMKWCKIDERTSLAAGALVAGSKTNPCYDLAGGRRDRQRYRALRRARTRELPRRARESSRYPVRYAACINIRCAVFAERQCASSLQRQFLRVG